MIRISRAFALASLVVTFGCSGTDSTDGASATVEETTFAPSLAVDIPNSRRTTNGEYIRDITIGTGAAISAGQLLTVRYSLWLSTGTAIENNLNAATGFPFHLGTHEVISGWDEGIPGMRVGGKRQLIIPPLLAYGGSGSGQIPGNSVLVFIVEITAAQ
jgi:FKBP-type peptidyl-prolyl cis-trans isomerase